MRDTDFPVRMAGQRFGLDAARLLIDVRFQSTGTKHGIGVGCVHRALGQPSHDRVVEDQGFDVGRVQRGCELSWVGEHFTHLIVTHVECPGCDVRQLGSELTFDVVGVHADQVLALRGVNNVVHHDREATTLQTAADVRATDVLVRCDGNQELRLEVDNLFSVLALSTQRVTCRRQFFKGVQSAAERRFVSQQQQPFSDQAVPLKAVSFDRFEVGRMRACVARQSDQHLLQRGLTGTTGTDQVKEALTRCVPDEDSSAERLNDDDVVFAYSPGQPVEELRAVCVFAEVETEAAAEVQVTLETVGKIERLDVEDAVSESHLATVGSPDGLTSALDGAEQAGFQQKEDAVDGSAVVALQDTCLYEMYLRLSGCAV
jgi:hypothetical protein